MANNQSKSKREHKNIYKNLLMDLCILKAFSNQQ